MRLSLVTSALSIFKRFFNQNQTKFIILGVVFFVLSFLGTLPYFNLILTKTLVLFIVWVLAVFLLKFSGKASVVGALILLGICPFFLIFKNEHLAEEAANLAFGLLVVGAIQMFRNVLRN